MINTKHKYINDFNVKATDIALILGTIHPHKTELFKMDFFYGNKNSIWTILSDAFPNCDFKNKESIIQTLTKNKIWISDIISECDREQETVTEDKSLLNIVKNDIQIKDGILRSEISTIFFTSGFGKNNAARLFCNAFNLFPILNEERVFTIPSEVFGRTIKCIVLFSPSGQANIGISKNSMYLRQLENYKNYKNPVSKFKIDFYINAFENYFINES